ncbi:hypothetical protein [Nocardia sp. Root136]|uniref:hypothetical protein n=1 Tax=Nocardia sp. Root136 TaxID=1736458 RepID=UPI000A7B54B6|nr:hypothetical protein [Nocardia sp. Root136]
MGSTVTDEQIRTLAATAKPYSVVLLHWGPKRSMDGADAIEFEHQRRVVSLRAEGVIAVLCPVVSDTVAGVAIMTVSAEQAAEIMAADPAFAPKCCAARYTHAMASPATPSPHVRSGPCRSEQG